MAAPVFQTSVPSNGQTDVVKNPAITATFDIALDPASVTPETVTLRNTRTGTVIIGQVSLSADGRTITFIPDAHLWPNSTHRLNLIGVDVSTSCIKSTTDDSLVTSGVVAFQTGESLESSTTVPEDGEADFPSDVGYVSDVPVRLVSAAPRHNAFGIRINTDQLIFKFSTALDPATVSGNVLVDQEAYYGEDDLRAVETDIGDGDRHYFRCETGTLTGLDAALYADRAYAISAVDDKIYVDFQTGVEFTKNLCVQVTLAAEIADVDGNTIGEDLIWFGCTEPYPEWVNLMGLRHTVGPSIAGEVSDDFIGLRIWQQTIDFAHDLNWRVNMAHPPRGFIKWIRNKAALDIWDDLISSKALSAGTSKELGDFTIRVNTAAGSARPTRVRRLEAELDKLRYEVYGYLAQTPRVGIKSINDAWEPGRGYFRDRLWRAELMMNRDVAVPASVANTMAQRNQGSDAISYGYHISLITKGPDHYAC